MNRNLTGKLFLLTAFQDAHIIKSRQVFNRFFTMGSLGKYDLIEQLGSGSMGTVYLARDTVLDRKVALKTIRTGGNVDEEVRERFYREAKTCARLQHPSIVAVFDMGEESDFAYIAMELLLGSDLKKHIEQRSDLPLVTKLESMIQICEALSHAHREGIVHRDVKPSNLFLTTDNRAKVLDFGIARLPSSRLTMVGRVLGTPNYMAPEQILGTKSDGRADLFSAAVVFFELLVYHHPFQSALIPRRIVDSEPDSIFDHDSDVPIPFEQIFKKALNKDPEQRYSTGSDLGADIRAVLDGVRQNASPTFSSVSLPSARSLPVEPVPENPIFNQESDAGDPEEQRLSEFLHLLPYFEDAVDRRAYGDASTALNRLRAIEAVDSRFVDSVRICESRLAAIDPGSSNEVPVKHSIPGDNGAVTEAIADYKCTACGALNRGGAVFCFECGARRDSERNAQSPTSADLGPAAEPTVLYGPLLAPQEASVAVVVPQARPKQELTSSAGSWLVRTGSMVKQQVLATSVGFRIRLAIITGAAVAILLVLMLISVIRRPVVQSYVATAKVRPGSAQLYESRDSSRPVATTPPGTLLNILERPSSGSTGWLKAQWVEDGKPKAQGYARRGSLHDFDSKDADTLLQFARTEGPGETGSIPELTDQIAAYEHVESRYPGTQAARVATEEEAKLSASLARLHAPELPPVTVASGPPPETTQAAAPIPASPAVSVTYDLARAKRLFGVYRYDEALRSLQRVLSLEPRNKEALALRQSVIEAKDAEETKH